MMDSLLKNNSTHHSPPPDEERNDNDNDNDNDDKANNQILSGEESDELDLDICDVCGLGDQDADNLIVFCEVC